MNTVLRNTFESDDLKTRAATVSNTIKYSKSLVENFKRTAKEENLPTALKQECQTRWNTMFDMLQSVSKNYTAIKEVLEKRGELQKIRNIDDYTLHRLVRLLEPFKTSTTRLEGDRLATMHQVLVRIEDLKNSIENFIREEFNPELKYVANRCLKFVSEKFEFHDLHRMAAFLWTGFQDLKFLGKKEQKRLKEMVMSRLKRIKEMNAETELLNNSDSTSSEITVELDEANDPSLEKYRNTPVKKTDNEVAFEIKSYKMKQASQNVNVLQWWRRHQHEFPLLSTLARSLLAIPATSASSERCFSVAGRVLEERRSQLSPESLDALLFLHSAHKCNSF